VLAGRLGAFFLANMMLIRNDPQKHSQLNMIKLVHALHHLFKVYL
jgi:hypothetical protein